MQPSATARTPSWSALISLIRLAPAQIAGKTGWTLTTLGTTLLVPVFVANVVNQVLAGREAFPALAALAGLLLLSTVAEASSEVVGVSAEARVAVRLRHRLLRHIFALGVPGLRRRATGDLVSRVTGNAGKSAKAVPYVVEVAVIGLSSLGGLVALCMIDWLLGLSFVVTMIPTVVLLRRMVNKSSKAYGEYLNHLAGIAARLAETVAGSRTIRASGAGRREVDRVLAPMPDLVRSGLETWKVRRAVSWQLALTLTLVRVIVLVVAGLGVTEGRISPGGLVAAVLYLGVALGLVGEVDTLFFLADSRASASRALEVLDEQPRTRADRGAVLPAGAGELRFRGVTVVLGDRIVLDRVDLHPPAGAAVAVVGRSGTGKTTLGLLVGGLLDPDGGEVLIDGVDVRRLDPVDLRRAVSYAFDTPVLLGNTVRDAIAFGGAGIGGPQVERAARIAQAEDFIRRLPAGFDTPLTDAPFSGGELQRLGLARAVAHGGRVLVLDDATSNLDTITEAKLTAAVTEGLAGHTRLIIAHRAVTAARADLVAWLENGRIRALAPHRVLWTEPEYRAVFAAPSGLLESVE